MKVRDGIFGALLFVAPAYTVMAMYGVGASIPVKILEVSVVVATLYTVFAVLSIIAFVLFQHYQLSTGVEFQRRMLALQLEARAGWLRWAILGFVLMLGGLTAFSVSFFVASLALLSLKLRAEDISISLNKQLTTD